MKPADLVRLLVLSALWGGSFIFMRVAAPALGPFVLVFCRVGLAGFVLLLYARIIGQALELRARWPQYVVIGALNSACRLCLFQPPNCTLRRHLRRF